MDQRIMKNNSNQRESSFYAPNDTKWPKKLPDLQDEQIRIKDEWMKYWHEVLPNKYGIIEKFNHGYPSARFNWTNNDRKCKTLEIGAGLGEHIFHEKLEQQDYYALELRNNMAERIRDNFGDKITTIVGDCQNVLPFEDDFFDRVIAIHVLEHLPDLPRALFEIYRVLHIKGEFIAVIPCEGGLAYSFCRKISSERIFHKKFKMDYSWLMKTEHINVPKEILEEIEKLFTIKSKAYFPLVVPCVNVNVAIGLTLTPKDK